jgi:hypothetical protein
MLTRALRMLAVVIAVALPVWVTPDRVDAAEPVGWSPIFVDDFTDPAHWHTGCTELDEPGNGGYLRPDEVGVAADRLALGIRRRPFLGREFTLGGITCGALTQQYGCYEFAAAVPSAVGVSALIELTPRSGDERQTSSVEVINRPGAPALHVVNGSDHGVEAKDKNLDGAALDGDHAYVVVWDPSGFRVLVDGNQVFFDEHPSREWRAIGFSVLTGGVLTGVPDATTVLPNAVQINSMFAWAYDPKASPDPTGVETCAPPAAAPPVVATGSDGRWVWWLVGALAAVVVIAIVIVTMRRRGPRRLGPGHRA